MENHDVIRDDEARCAAALPDGVPDRIMVMPAGEVRTKPHDGHAPWRLDDAAAVVAAVVLIPLVPRRRVARSETQ